MGDSVLKLTPGAFTKHANLSAMLAVMAGVPLLDAASGLMTAPAHPIQSTASGIAGGVAGGALGAGAGAGAMALLQAIAKKQIDPALLARAATLGALLGAVGGGREASSSMLSATGVPQEAILSAILEELQAKNRPAQFRPDLLR